MEVHFRSSEQNVRQTAKKEEQLEAIRFRDARTTATTLHHLLYPYRTPERHFVSNRTLDVVGIISDSRLEAPPNNSHCPVNLRITGDGKVRIIVAKGIYVRPRDWNDQEKRALASEMSRCLGKEIMWKHLDKAAFEKIETFLHTTLRKDANTKR